MHHLTIFAARYANQNPSKYCDISYACGIFADAAFVVGACARG